MRILELVGIQLDHTYRWPDGSEEPYPYCVKYRAESTTGMHDILVGFGLRFAYGCDRRRIVVWVDKHPHAEFLGADDFGHSGEVLSEIKVPGDKGERICRYPEEPIPERYTGLSVVRLPLRVSATGVHSAWAVVANIADHRSFIALAGLRRTERER